LSGIAGRPFRKSSSKGDLLEGRPAQPSWLMLAFLFLKGAHVERWIPLLWIIGGGIGILFLLLFIDFLKGRLKKRSH